jgi:hypothetical protein
MADKELKIKYVTGDYRSLPQAPTPEDLEFYLNGMGGSSTVGGILEFFNGNVENFRQSVQNLKKKKVISLDGDVDEIGTTVSVKS